MTFKTITKIVPVQSLKSLLQPHPKEDTLVDGLRGLSAIMIVIFHAMFAVYFLFKNRPELFQLYIEQFDFPLRFLFGFDKAVDIFFMISAYLLGKQLIGQARSKGIQARRFYLNRLFRIYPLFIIALILYSLGSWHLFERDFWFNLIFIDNFMHNTIIPVGWSLSVEMQCYLVLPLVIYLSEKSKYPVCFIAVLLLLSVGLRGWVALTHPEVYQVPFHSIFMNPSIDYQYMGQMYYATPSRLSSFIVGLLWAAIVMHEKFQHYYNRISQNRWFARPLILFCAMLMFVSLFFPIYDAKLWQHWPVLESINLYLVVLHRVAFAMALLIIILLVRKPTSLFVRLLSWRVLRVYSKLAFPVYLFHFPVLAISWLLVMQTTNLKSIEVVTPLQTAAAALIALILVAWVALPLHFLIEHKGIRFGQRLNQKLSGQ
ncbi:acyltransferase [Reinekea marina]|uniref:Acyltransferase family protein n=1 Tax=Reinekea marina TaxID=1310421 RepID=A0ABV7WW93_9GAMM|nr:acyltransferase [Reinekea marina]MDN3648886.1 acyltransferase [Reinekea marina]